MDSTHFDRMKRARKAEAQSPHPTHQVGALIAGIDLDGNPFEVSHFNFWPFALVKHFGKDIKLGNASTTIHAELATLFKAPRSENADIYITDLPCPNCSKTIAEAGIKNVYIDTHTHNTPLGRKIKPFFDAVSLFLFEKAGIGVFEVDLEKGTINTLSAADPKRFSIDKPEQVFALNAAPSQSSFMQEIEKRRPDTAFAACAARDEHGHHFIILAKTEIPAGLTKDDAQAIRSSQNKYMPSLQPINRLIALAAKHGLQISKRFVFSSRTPTSREFVNLIGADITHLIIEDKTQCRDEWGLSALSALQKVPIIDFNDMHLVT